MKTLRKAGREEASPFTCALLPLHAWASSWPAFQLSVGTKRRWQKPWGSGDRPNGFPGSRPWEAFRASAGTLRDLKGKQIQVNTPALL